MPENSDPSAAEQPPLQSTLEHYPEHVYAIGMISIELANLEIVLGELLGALLHIAPEFGTLVYLTPKANMARLDVLNNVANYTFTPKSPHRVQTEKIIATARRLIGKRHQFIHGAWGIPQENLKEVHLRSLPFLDEKGSRIVPLSELEEDVNHLRKLVEAVRDFTRQLYFEWPPYTLPRTRPEQDPHTSQDQPPAEPDAPQEL